MSLVHKDSPKKTIHAPSLSPKDQLLLSALQLTASTYDASIEDALRVLRADAHDAGDKRRRRPVGRRLERQPSFHERRDAADAQRQARQRHRSMWKRARRRLAAQKYEHDVRLTPDHARPRRVEGLEFLHGGPGGRWGTSRERDRRRQRRYAANPYLADWKEEALEKHLVKRRRARAGNPIKALAHGGLDIGSEYEDDAATRRRKKQERGLAFGSATFRASRDIPVSRARRPGSTLLMSSVAASSEATSQ